jgi:hypothetical protein
MSLRCSFALNAQSSPYPSVWFFDHSILHKTFITNKEGSTPAPNRRNSIDLEPRPIATASLPNPTASAEDVKFEEVEVSIGLVPPVFSGAPGAVVVELSANAVADMVMVEVSMSAEKVKERLDNGVVSRGAPSSPTGFEGVGFSDMALLQRPTKSVVKFVSKHPFNYLIQFEKSGLTVYLLL